ncbi:MAG: hypothetical protein ACFB9M_11560 [Myxococcota bacterium]
MVRFRPEVGMLLLVAVGLAGWTYAGAVLGVIGLHELAHGVMARALNLPRAEGRPPWIDLQLGAGDAYLGQDYRRGDGLVLAAGCLVTGLCAAGFAAVGSSIGMWAALHWLAFQSLPHPASDSGVLWRRWAVHGGWSERHAFLALLGAAAIWIPGALGGLAWAMGPRTIETWVPWTGLAVGVAASEWPAVLWVDAYRAWTTGRPELALTLAKGRSGRRHRSLRRLGLRAALQLQRRDPIVDLLADLPALDPQALQATMWLLRHDDPVGARRCELVVDVLAAGAPPSPDAVETVAEFGLFEARRGARESALGLFEQAVGWGFQRIEWFAFRPEARIFADCPRWQALQVTASGLPRPGESG